MIELYQDLIDDLENSPLATWAQQMPQQIAQGLCSKRFGDLPDWLQALGTTACSYTLPH